MITPQTVVLICGPTASGKTGLSISLAKKINGVVINGDSMQIYEDLAILSARPDTQEMDGIEHRLFGTIPIKQHYSVAQWRAAALQNIDDIHKQNKIPIIVGGTGLYFKALIEGLSPIPEITMETRQRICDLYDALGAEEFHKKLVEIDPEIADRLPPTDRQRSIRAMEVYEDTGKPMSYWQKAPRISAPDHLVFKAFILKPERQALYDKIDLRFDLMMENGAMNEVKAIHAQNLDPLLPSLKAVGLPPLRDYLDGVLTQEDAVETAKLQSRRYAKRQFTWFNNQMPPQIRDHLSIWHIPMPTEIDPLVDLLSS